MNVKLRFFGCDTAETDGNSNRHLFYVIKYWKKTRRRSGKMHLSQRSRWEGGQARTDGEWAHTHTRESFWSSIRLSRARSTFSFFISNLIIIIQRKRDLIARAHFFVVVVFFFVVVFSWFFCECISVSSSALCLPLISHVLRPNTRHIENTMTVRQEFSVNFVESESSTARARELQIVLVNGV